jgi:hypothetical protein
MKKASSLATTFRIEQIIHDVRNRRVILDSDLAAIYGVSTKALNQAVKRNTERFPNDFAFQLNSEEAAEFLRSQNVISKKLSKRSQVTTEARGGRRYFPYVFTEHGALMAANVLRSPRAVEMSVFVVRAFVLLRQGLAHYVELSRRLNDMEKKYDVQFNAVYDAIRQLILPRAPKKKQIGFRAKDSSASYAVRKLKSGPH